MKIFISFISLISLLNVCFGQTIIANPTILAKSYCDSNHRPCKNIYLRGTNGITPFDNYCLCEYFNPKQTDFSEAYLKLELKNHKDKNEQLKRYLNYDFSSIWQTGNYDQDGVFGPNYQRIQVYFKKVYRSRKNKSVYIVEGKTKVNDTIRRFNGKITLLKLFVEDSCINCDSALLGDLSGDLFANYEFREGNNKGKSGIYKGVQECTFYIDSIQKAVKLNTEYEGYDYTWNRNFVGIWTDYKTKKAKKCIWGDDRLPFVFDFEMGDGEMYIPEKYVQNGWQNFNGHPPIDEKIRKWWLDK